MPSTLDTLIARVSDERLRADLASAVSDLRKITDFGLVFEAHIPETLRLPQHAIRRGIKVALRDVPDQSMFEVVSIDEGVGTVLRLRHPDGSVLSPRERAETEPEEIDLSKLVALAEFGDAIYPGLRHLGSLRRGEEVPAHILINGENHHVLEALRFSHSGKVDCIYIDPPYNSGARDWKYNNNYVDAEDGYRHSKWLAFMDRRLRLARQLLNPDDSVLIVSVDEKEYLRLGLLLEQLFPGAGIQMVTSVTNPAGAGRDAEFSRIDEYIFFVRFGAARILPEQRDEEARPITWDTFRRSDLASRRGTAKGGTSQFYPIYVNRATRKIDSIGEPLDHAVPRDDAPEVPGCATVFPIRPDGTEMNWGLTPDAARQRLADGYLRAGQHKATEPQEYSLRAGPSRITWYRRSSSYR